MTKTVIIKSLQNNNTIFERQITVTQNESPITAGFKLLKQAFGLSENQARQQYFIETI